MGASHEIHRNDFRSGLEYRHALFLLSRGINYAYEDMMYEYWYPSPARGLECLECGSRKIGKWGWYNPDFFYPNGVRAGLKCRTDVR